MTPIFTAFATVALVSIVLVGCASAPGVQSSLTTVGSPVSAKAVTSGLTITKVMRTIDTTSDKYTVEILGTDTGGNFALVLKVSDIGAYVDRLEAATLNGKPVSTRAEARQLAGKLRDAKVASRVSQAVWAREMVNVLLQAF